MNAVETVEETENARKAAALALAERGFWVFAVDRADKRPDKLLAPNGFKSATRDPDVIAGWFDVKPKCCIGIACGAEYGLVVLDFDIKNGNPGAETYRDLWLGNEMTLTADTPSGGWHLYFRHPGVVLKSGLPGLDIKGADGGGYVLAPPSLLPDGAYKWREAEMPIAPFPDYLLSELRAGAPAKKTETKPAAGPVAATKTREGSRHKRLVELGAIYRGKGLSSEEIEVLLWEHAKRYFDPPFNPDNQTDAKEIEAVIRWYGGKEPGGETATALTVLSTAELVERAKQAPQPMLMDPILPMAGNLMIHGQTGAGKSHLGLSVSLALSQGGRFLDWCTNGPVTTLYVDGEMPLDELSTRICSYVGAQPLPERLHWIAARASDTDLPDLGDPAGQALYLEAIERFKARVVVFDNLSCLRLTSTDTPENSVEAWHPIATFIRRLNVLGIAVIIIHHSAKSGTQRGSSAHTAVMDTVLRLVPPGEGQADPLAANDVEIVFEKHRRFGGEAALPFRAKAMEDPDGFCKWIRATSDPLATDCARLHLEEGLSIREIAKVMGRSKAGIEKALNRAKAKGLLPLTEVK